MNKKLNKKLLNLIALCSGITAALAVGIGGIVYSLQEKSGDEPIDQNVLPDSVYEINNDNVLLGFKIEFLNDSASPIYKDNFKDCHTMQIPTRVKEISNEAFYANYSSTIPSFIKNLTFAQDSKCSSIGDRAFDSCKSITSITLPNSLNSIGVYAFRNCQSLPLITLPSNLTEINNSAFTDCTSLTTVDFSNAINLCSISDSAFLYCSKLTSVDLSKCTNLSIIETYAFNRCSSLTSISFPSSLTEIQEAAFYSCLSITSITFPSNLSSIGNAAFGLCPQLNSITWDAWKGNTTLPYSDAFSGVCPDGGTVTVTNPSDDAHDSAALLEYLLNNGGLPESWAKDVTNSLPESVYKYDESDPTILTGFSDEFLANPSAYSEYDTMEIPSGVTSIADLAFCDEENQTTTIPEFINNLTFAKGSRCSLIGEGAFMVSPLISINLPDSLASIRGFAFGATAITSVSFPSSLSEIGDGAFTLCSSLTSVDFSNCSSLNSTGDYVFDNCLSLISLDFSNCLNLASIGEYVFRNCSKLTSIDLSNCPNLTDIQRYAFKECSSLTSVDFSNCSSLNSINTSAFCDCDSLTSISFPSSLTTIGYSAFDNCKSLNYIEWYLPSDYETSIAIDTNAFSDISSSGKVKSLRPDVDSNDLLDWLQDKEGGYINPKGGFPTGDRTDWKAV